MPTFCHTQEQRRGRTVTVGLLKEILKLLTKENQWKDLLKKKSKYAK